MTGIAVTHPGAWLGPWLAALGLLAGCDGRSPQPQAGEPAPSFVVQHLDGSQGRFPDDYRGQVVALRFWADWCPFCKSEMQAIEPIYRRERDVGLAVLAMNVGQPREVAEHFASALGLSYTIALDPDAVVSGRYGVVGLPLTYFVDRQGTIRHKVLGETSAEIFEAMALALLREPPP